MTTETSEKDSIETPSSAEFKFEGIKKEDVKETKAETKDEESTAADVKGGEDETHDPYYPPIVSLPLVDVHTGEDGEVEVFKRRAKLYR